MPLSKAETARLRATQEEAGILRMYLDHAERALAKAERNYALAERIPKSDRRNIRYYISQIKETCQVIQQEIDLQLRPEPFPDATKLESLYD